MLTAELADCDNVKTPWPYKVIKNSQGGEKWSDQGGGIHWTNTIFKDIFLGLFLPLLLRQHSWRVDRKQRRERGNDMQQRARGGIEPMTPKSNLPLSNWKRCSWQSWQTVTMWKHHRPTKSKIVKAVKNDLIKKAGNIETMQTDLMEGVQHPMMAQHKSFYKFIAKSLKNHLVPQRGSSGGFFRPLFRCRARKSTVCVTGN